MTAQPEAITECAEAILAAYDRFCQPFNLITRRAKTRFEGRDWHGVRADANERLDLYEHALDDVVDVVHSRIWDRREEGDVWQAMKGCYSKLIQERHDLELAETFYNSVIRQVFAPQGVDQESELLYSGPTTRAPQPAEPIYRTYHTRGTTTAQTVEKILRDCDFQVPFDDLLGDAKAVAERIEARLWQEWHRPTWNRIEVLKPLFYRNKATYVIGRIWKQDQMVPLMIVLLHVEKGIFIDAVLLTNNEISIVFSFARSYFLVDETWSQGVIQFLKPVMPLKRVSDLYFSLGHNRHGKRELFDDLFRHLRTNDDEFIFAPGIKGMVMIVFTLTSFPVVFKVIRDRFAPPKVTTRAEVMEKYHLVFKHDRVGRLVDAHEFEHVRFEKRLFSQEVLDELLESAGDSVTIDGDLVVIKHLYTERRLTPLDIYVQEAPLEIALEAVNDYGRAIKQLAAANVFPGDIFLKNFGVTRTGRVVFYDYDELVLLTDCRFRRMPPPRTYEDELASEPWFHVAEGDVFPEEFPHFLGLNGSMREEFFARHGDLCDIIFWQQIQARQVAGEIIDFFPYKQRIRLRTGQT